MGRINDFLERLASRPAAPTEDFGSTLAELIVSTDLLNYPYTRQRALVVAAIYRARQLNSDTIASVPLMAGDTLLPAPNRHQNMQEFLAETILALQDHGDAGWLINGGSGDLEVANPDLLIAEWDGQWRRRLYTYESRRMRTTGAGRNLLVLSINRAREDLTGTGPMQSERIRGLIAEQRYVQEYYENAAMPSGTLNHPSPLSPEEAELLRVKWEEINAKRSTSVLSGGIEYKPLSFNLTDSQWTEGHMVGIGDVANLFGLPGELLNYSAPGSSLTYKNIGSVFEEYWRTYARPTYATRIEEALTGLFSTSITFDPSALFAASMRDRTASTSALVSAGYDPADVLETVGLPPMEHLGGTPTTFYDDDSTADQEAPA